MVPGITQAGLGQEGLVRVVRHPGEVPHGRIIFLDTEKSNWTWDEEAGAFFWHRFFSHQPDLNYDNEDVQEQMLAVIRFWLDLGLDGYRLPAAVPYLYERQGTNGENLPETHDFLKRVRKEVDSLYDDVVLLAEANQWPARRRRLLRWRRRMPHGVPLPAHAAYVHVGEASGPIPDGRDPGADTQHPGELSMGIFLRNHDELTLEMVTDEERDYMYNEYAKDPRMKLNLGIRRRLAPLLDNSRDQTELFHAMLLSLPGTPIVYYGDEIGMGDNIYLGDRDGVRTPMQWNGDRNKKFSSADFAQLYLPVLLDSVYGYQSVNVESEQRNQSSFLQWFRRLVSVRKQHEVFGLGSFESLHPENPAIFPYIRRLGDDVILCVNNLSPAPARAAELDLSPFEGLYPIEMLGRERFPRIGSLPYLLTFGPHSFYWFQLVPEETL